MNERKGCSGFKADVSDTLSIIQERYGAIRFKKRRWSILKYIGCILKSQISQSNLYYRMYADNFAILTEYRKDSDFGYIANVLQRKRGDIR